ncbi:MAG: NAD(P)H-hydrate dehydratase [Vicinamibacterales bacterium]
MRVLNGNQMREADRQTIEEIGIPSIVLMENAGRQVVGAIEARYPDIQDRAVAILSGRGNNGGDGFVVARVLHERGVDVSVFLVGRVAEIKGDARINLEILGNIGVTVVEIEGEEQWELHSTEVGSADLIVDALFGTGLKTPLQGLLETIVADVNGMGIPIVSIDLPSGLSADTHEAIGDSIEAELTVTLAAPKLPLALPPALFRAGEVAVADIGIPRQVIDAVEGDRIELVTRDEVRDLIEPRAAESHKGDFGHVLIVAGSLGKTGAAHLAAVGALKSGAGLVTVATPRSVVPIVAALGAEYMTYPLAETTAGTVAAEAIEDVLALQRDVIAVGPGLGTDPSTREFVRALVEASGVPLVLDADALNAFADEPLALSASEGRNIIVTPHPGEMARLTGLTTTEIQGDRIAAARRLATTRHLFVVLKGYRTIVAAPSGSVSINTTGNPGLATGGTGDVLTGVIAAWLAQLLDAEGACRLGVYLHGAAADLAEADVGEIALTAGDVVERLGDAVLELTARNRRPGRTQ